jgi:hypothetical protein
MRAMEADRVPVDFLKRSLFVCRMFVQFHLRLVYPTMEVGLSAVDKMTRMRLA